MSQLSNIFDFQKFQVGKWGRQIKKDPERLFIGAADPFSSKMWGKALGKDYEPMVTQGGGSPKKTEYEANAAGINTQSHNNVDSLAKALSAFYTGKWASGLGGSGSAAGSGSSLGGSTLGSGYESVGGAGTYSSTGPALGSGYESVGGAGTYSSSSTPSQGFDWQSQLQQQQPQGGQNNPTNSYDEYIKRKQMRQLAEQLQKMKGDSYGGV